VEKFNLVYPQYELPQLPQTAAFVKNRLG